MTYTYLVTLKQKIMYQTKMNELIDELININDIAELIRQRQQFTKYIPIELLHNEDRELCDKIDNYLNSKK